MCRLIPLFFIFLISSSHSHARDVSISGFGTIGVLSTDKENFRFRTDMAQNKGAEKGEWPIEPLSKLGIQFDIVINDEWDIVSQFVYRQQDRQNLDSTTSLAFVRYKPNANWQIRAGRISPNVFQQSEVRDIGIAYMWTKVPTEVYGPVPVRNLNGAELSYFDYFGDAFFHASFLTGNTKSDFTSGAYRPIYFEDLIGLSVSIESFDWTVAARYVQATIDNSVTPFTEIVNNIKASEPIWLNATDFANRLSFKDKSISYGSVYGEYRFEHWQVSAELTTFESESLVINGTTSGYLNVAYPYEQHTFYATASFINSDGHEFDEQISQPQMIPELLVFTREALDFFDINQNTYSVGWRYDLSPQLAIKLQLEKSNIREAGNGLRVIDGFRYLSGKESVSTFFATVDFSF